MTEVSLRARRLRIHRGTFVGSGRGATHATALGAVDLARAATAQVLGQGGGQDRAGDGIRAVLAVFQRPLLDRTVDQAEVVNASIFASRFTSFDEVRDRDRGQKTDDGDDDHDFNEREARFA